jgi:hypothetical protein
VLIPSICVYAHHSDRSTETPNTLETWSAAASPPRRLCYRPAVFFRQLRLTALSFPQEKIRLSFQKKKLTWFVSAI